MVREALRQLLYSVVQSPGDKDLSRMLVHLEEAADESLEEFRLVRWVRQRLRRGVGALVAVEVGHQCCGGDEEEGDDSMRQLTANKMRMVAPAILSKVMQSPELLSCLAHMKELVRQVSQEMRGNIDAELDHVTNGASAITGWMGYRRSLLERSDSGHDSLTSSASFLQPQQYVRLGERLNRFSPAEVRVEALEMLLHSQLSDVVASAAWEEGPGTLREGLRAALLDSDQTIAAASLRIHARLLSNVNANVTREAFGNLTAALAAYYRDKTASHTLPTAGAGLLFKKKTTHGAFCQVIRLLADVSAEMPRYWTRYPDKVVVEIVQDLFRLLSLGGNGRSKLLYPRHLMAVVDPRANWLKRWLHGEFGRAIVLKQLEQSVEGSSPLANSWLINLISSLESSTRSEEWMLIRNAFRGSSARRKGAVAEPLMAYGSFSHSLHAVCHLLHYERGAQLLSLHKTTQALDAMVMFVTASTGQQLQQHPWARGPCDLVTRCLESLITSGSDSTRARLRSVFVLNRLLLPLKLWIEKRTRDDNTKRQQPPAITFVHAHVCRLLACVLKQCAMDAHLWEARDEVAKALVDEGLEVAIHFCTLALESHQSVSAKYLTDICFLAETLGSDHVSALQAGFPRLVETMCEVFMELSDMAITPTNSTISVRVENGKGEVDVAVITRLKSALLAVMATPKGVAFLIEEEMCLRVLLRGSWLIPSGRQNTFPLVAFSVSGTRLLFVERFVERHIVAMLETFKLEGEHWRPSPREAENKVMAATTLFAHLLASPSFLNATMKSKSILRDLLLFEENPFSSCNESGNVFALKLLSCVSADPHSLAYLEHNFGLSELLARQLAGGDKWVVAEDGTKKAIVDKETLYLSFILRSIKKLGGGGEMPQLSFEERDHWELYDDNDVPYEINSSHSNVIEDDLHPALKNGRGTVRDHVWLEGARKIFEERLTSRISAVSAQACAELIEEIAKVYAADPDRSHITASARDDSVFEQEEKEMSLMVPEDETAIAFMLKFASSPSVEHNEFRRLIAFARSCFRRRGEGKRHSFDWLTASIFIILDGHLERTKTVLRHLRSAKCVHFFLWQDISSSRMLLASTVCHWAELILLREAPQVYAVLSAERISVAILVQRWVSQVFLNVLPWAEVRHFLLLLLLFGASYAVYVAVALLRHLQPLVLKAVDRQVEDGRNLVEVLFTARSSDFSVGDYMPFMRKMDEKYGERIKHDFDKHNFEPSVQ